ncbi:MAG: hypothetical protein QOD75_1297 [Blastocatellia bacterium]|jgi:hypothetical protein|nr:hypothetical protein [Blastocatellia bacterium]MEA2952282.1 hypothetical protein [Alphaproteobacteria bacterium]
MSFTLRLAAAIIFAQVFMGCGAFSADVANLQRAVDEKQCPANPVTYRLEKYSDHCDNSGCNTFACASAWNACSNQVDRMNNTIIKYNSFVKNICKRNSDRKTFLTKPSLISIGIPGGNLLDICEKQVVQTNCDDKYDPSRYGSDITEKAVAACHMSQNSFTERCAWKNIKGEDISTARLFEKGRAQQGEEARIVSEWERMQRPKEPSPAVTVAPPPTPRPTPSYTSPQSQPGPKTSQFNVSSDLRSNCGGRGMYLVRSGSSTAYNVVCQGGATYCQGNFGGGRYVEDGGDRICLVP